MAISSSSTYVRQFHFREHGAASKVGKATTFPVLAQALVLTGFALPCSGVYGGGGSGATGGAVEDARPHVLPGAQAAPHEQDQVEGVCVRACTRLASILRVE